MNNVDGGILTPTGWGQSYIKKYNEQNVVLKDLYLKNSGGLYFENCSIQEISNIILENVYALYFKNCTGLGDLNLSRISVKGSGKGLYFNGANHGFRALGIESSFAKDPDTTDNGDGMLFEEGNYDNEFKFVYVASNRDAGIDCKGQAIFTHVVSEHNAKGFKLWGDIAFKGKVVTNQNRDNSILSVSGSQSFDDILMRNAGDIHVKMGLSDYASLTKKLVINGTSDKANWFTKDANSTLTQNVVVV